MQKLILRIVTVLVIPCLLLDPSWAGAAQRYPSDFRDSPDFNSQALSLGLQSAHASLFHRMGIGMIGRLLKRAVKDETVREEFRKDPELANLKQELAPRLGMWNLSGAALIANSGNWPATGLCVALGLGIYITLRLWRMSRESAREQRDPTWTRFGVVMMVMLNLVTVSALLKTLGWADFLSWYQGLQKSGMSRFFVSMGTGGFISFLGRLAGFWIRDHRYGKSLRTVRGLLILMLAWTFFILTPSTIGLYAGIDHVHNLLIATALSTAGVMSSSSVLDFLDPFQMALADEGRVELSPGALKKSHERVWALVMIRAPLVWLIQNLIQHVLPPPLRILVTYYTGVILNLLRGILVHDPEDLFRDRRWIDGMVALGVLSAIGSVWWVDVTTAIGALLCTALAYISLTGRLDTWMKMVLSRNSDQAKTLRQLLDPALARFQRVGLVALMVFLRYPVGWVLGLGNRAVVRWNGNTRQSAPRRWLDPRLYASKLQVFAANLVSQSASSICKTFLARAAHPAAIVFVPAGFFRSEMAEDLFQTFPRIQALYDQISLHASTFLGPIDVAQASFHLSNEELASEKNFVTIQLATFAHQAAVWELVQELGISPTAVIGLSRGLSAALYACGALTLEQAVEQTVRGSRFALTASRESGLRMRFVGNIAPEKLLSILGQNDSVIAIEISGREFVISAPLERMGYLVAAFRTAGADFPDARIPIGAHDDRLRTYQSGELFAAYQAFLDRVLHAGKVPQLPLGSGLRPGFRLATAGDVVQEMSASFVSPVLWAQSLKAMAGAGIRHFIQVGTRHDSFLRHQQADGFLSSEAQLRNLSYGRDFTEIKKQNALTARRDTLRALKRAGLMMGAIAVGLMMLFQPFSLVRSWDAYWFLGSLATRFAVTLAVAAGLDAMASLYDIGRLHRVHVQAFRWVLRGLGATLGLVLAGVFMRDAWAYVVWASAGMYLAGLVANLLNVRLNGGIRDYIPFTWREASAGDYLQRVGIATSLFYISRGLFLVEWRHPSILATVFLWPVFPLLALCLWQQQLILAQSKETRADGTHPPHRSRGLGASA